MGPGEAGHVADLATPVGAHLDDQHLMLRSELLVDGSAHSQDRVEAGSRLEDSKSRLQERLGEVLGGCLAVAAGDSDDHWLQPPELAPGPDAVGQIDRHLDRREADVGGNRYERRGVDRDDGHDQDRQAGRIGGGDGRGPGKPRECKEAGHEQEGGEDDRNGQEASGPTRVDERLLPRGARGGPDVGQHGGTRGERRREVGAGRAATGCHGQVHDGRNEVDDPQLPVNAPRLQLRQPPQEPQVRVVVLLERVKARHQPGQRQNQCREGRAGHDDDLKEIGPAAARQEHLTSHPGTG